MITIKQLLESVDLDFEPRFVTKDKDGMISIFAHKPIMEFNYSRWCITECRFENFGPIKLSEFDGKDWTECIYEVPRKEKGIAKLIHEKLTIGKTKYEYPTNEMLRLKINELVDAVNELKGAKNE